MPVYEYECLKCGHRFERLMRMGAEPPPCPNQNGDGNECGGVTRQKISGTSIRFKGDGFYSTDYTD